MKQLLTLSLATIFALTLAACGQTPGERAVSGAGLGAAAGAAGTALTGGNPTTGALIGGAVGGATGYFTDEHDVYMGEPAWK